MLLLLLLAGGALWVFGRHPIHLAAQDEVRAGSPVSAREAADVLLVVDPEVVTAAGGREQFDALDLSYGWVNLAEQEVGRFAVIAPGDIVQNALQGRRVVVITRSAMRAAELWLPQLKLFVEDGGVLVLERPTSRWDFVSGVEVVSTAPQPLRELSGLRMADVRELPGMPWRTMTEALKVVRSEVEVLAESGGQPVVVRRNLGRGAVIVLGLDVGRQLTSLQQGTPASGSMAVENRYRRLLKPGRHTDDLVADPKLLTSSVPYADVFERFVMALIEQVAPLPHWWSFPNAAPGAYLATQDEQRMGDVAGWMAEAERAQGVTSTCFLAMGKQLSPLGLERFAPTAAGGGCTLGLSWDLDREVQGSGTPEGLQRLWPVVRQTSLAQQGRWFFRLTGHPFTFSRTLDVEWDDRWAEPFRKLAALQVRMDSSFGPSGSRGNGYLFGTGLPFLVLDPNGLPFSDLRELPFLVSYEGRRLARETLPRLLEQSAELYHEAVVSRLSPAAFLTEPDVELYRMWKDSFADARRLGLWITDLQSLDTFLAARREGALSSTFQGGMLMATAQAVAEGQTLSLPAEWSGRPAGPVTVDGNKAEPQRVRAVGGDLLLLPLPRGTHSVVVEYLEVK